MSEKRNVVIKANGGDVVVEVVVTNQKPAAITVALYGADRRKEKDLGSALTLEPPDPDVFDIATSAKAASLNGKIIGVFVAIAAFDASVDQPVSVVATLRQDGQAIANGTVVDPAVVSQGGAGSIIGYVVTVLK
jgi:hypothetical protein